jgi:hypothetical protein
VDDNHRVRLPRLSGHLVPNTALKIDDLFAAKVDAAGAAQLAASSEIFSKRVAHTLESATDVTFDRECV